VIHNVQNVLCVYRNGQASAAGNPEKEYSDAICYYSFNARHEAFPTLNNLKLPNT